MERLSPTFNDRLISGHFMEIGQTYEYVQERDQKAREILGYSQQELADLLAPLCTKARTLNEFTYPAVNGIEYQAKIIRYRGKACPFGDRADPRKYSTSVDIFLAKVGETEPTLLIGGLLWHLIEIHGFHEGCPPYRLAPETIVEWLGVERIPGSIEKAKNTSF